MGVLQAEGLRRWSALWDKAGPHLCHAHTFVPSNEDVEGVFLQGPVPTNGNGSKSPVLLSSGLQSQLIVFRLQSMGEILALI